MHKGLFKNYPLCLNCLTVIYRFSVTYHEYLSCLPGEVNTLSCCFLSPPPPPRTCPAVVAPVVPGDTTPLVGVTTEVDATDKAARLFPGMALAATVAAVAPGGLARWKEQQKLHLGSSQR